MKKLLFILFIFIACETESVRVEYPANGRYGINILSNNTEFISGKQYSIRTEPFDNLVEIRMSGRNIFFDQHTGWDLRIDELVVLTTRVSSDWCITFIGNDSTIIEYYENNKFIKTKTIHWNLFY